MRNKQPKFPKLIALLFILTECSTLYSYKHLYIQKFKSVVLPGGYIVVPLIALICVSHMTDDGRQLCLLTYHLS